jgi:protein dithiol:quinone oxidoreductase
VSTGLRSSRWLAGIAALSLAAVAAALVSQHALGMLPCPWCVLQRFVFVLIGGVALLGCWVSSVRRGSAALVLLLALGGIAAALWQHFVAAASASCNMTWADRIMGFTGLDRAWPEVFAAYASCGDAQVALFGVPYEGYSFVLFVLICAAAWQVLRPAARGA